MAISTAMALIGSAVIGGVVQSRAASKATKAQTAAADAGIEEQREARLAFEERTQPFVDIGLEAGGQLQNFLADPMQQLEQINPVVSFLRDQGFEQIQESAAARGRLSAGGTLKDLTEFNTNLAATVAPQLQNQRFNQLFNVMGAGQSAAVGQGTAALQTAGNIGNLLGQKGQAQATGAIQGSNVFTNTLGTLVQAGGAGLIPGVVTPPPIGGSVF